jgi:hypothetical protein
MRISILCLTCFILSSCTGVKSVDETWACVTGNVPDGKACKPIPAAETADDDSWGTTSSREHDKIQKNAATIPAKPKKPTLPEYPLKNETPPKTWGN